MGSSRSVVMFHQQKAPWSAKQLVLHTRYWKPGAYPFVFLFLREWGGGGGGVVAGGTHLLLES